VRIEENYSLKAHNTFGIDAKCKKFVEFENTEEAQEVARMLGTESLPYLIIGGGSNLLLTKDFEGIVVHSAIKGYSFEEDRMTCGSGMCWDEVVDTSIQAGYYGMENLSMIPGDVGASAVQNIGAYGVEAKDLILRVCTVEIPTGELHVWDNEECEYSYRQSRFKQDWKNRFLIVRVTYQLSKTLTPHLDYGNIRQELERQGISSPTAHQLRQTIIAIRQAKLPDPHVEGNAGSFFMNPVVTRAKYEELASEFEDMPHYCIDSNYEKIPAGWMIDQCGWKGKTLGRAGVHDKQALVLVNRGGASGKEIVDLCHEIQKSVKKKFGIDIHPEVNIV